MLFFLKQYFCGTAQGDLASFVSLSACCASEHSKRNALGKRLMKILSAYFAGGKNNDELKAVIIDISKDRYVLKSARTLSSAEFSALAENGRTRLTCEYADLLAEEEELPPVSDKKAATLLVKNKIQNVLKPNTDYTFAVHDAFTASPVYLPGSRTSRKSYTIYGVPSDFLDSYIGGALRSKLSVATFDRFALVPLSKKVDPKGVVCHIYADRSRIILSFSAGDNLIYARIADIPAARSTGEALNDFFYEIISLTWLYVKQTKQVPVGAIIFSGTLKGRIALEESVKSFCKQDLSYLNASDYIKNCDNSVFQEYLLAIGAAMAEENANFLPINDIELNVYKSALGKLNIVLCAILTALVIFGAAKFAGYTKKREQLAAAAETLNARLAALDEAVSDSYSLYYISSYLHILAEREKTPAALIVPIQELLGREKYLSAHFYGGAENNVTLAGVETFKTYTSSWLFAAEYGDYLKEFGIRVNIPARENSILNIPDRRLEIKTELGAQE